LTLLSVKNLVKEFPLDFFGREKLRAVDNISFDIDESKIVSLIGESGSGKTTVGKLILKLLKPTSGQILFHGEDIGKFSKNRKEYYKKVQGIFQDPYSSFNPIYKIDRVFEVVFDEFFPHVKNAQRKEKIEKVLTSVGMNPSQILGKYPHQLSGGQLQRILIARTLLLELNILIADEIISMLDASTRIDILNLLAKIKDKTGMSVIFITHDLSLGYYISDESFIMYRGNIVEMGDTQKVFHNPCHPYTKMLLESIPEIDRKWDFREHIKIETIEDESTGCKYFSRCNVREHRCQKQIPELIEIEENHKVMCFKFYG